MGMISGSDKKVLCQALSKLYLPPETDDDDKVRTLKLLVHNLRARRPPRDASALASLVKFDGALSKRFEKQLEDFNEAEYRQLQSLQGLFEFLDDIVPLDEDEDEEEEAQASKKRAARKRRSESVTTDATSTTDEWARKSPPSGKSGKTRSKCDPGLHCRTVLMCSLLLYRRRRTLQSDDDEDKDEDNTVEGSPPSAIPTRSMPRRAA
jgi:condensin complex subunit 3